MFYSTFWPPGDCCCILGWGKGWGRLQPDPLDHTFLLTITGHFFSCVPRSTGQSLAVREHVAIPTWKPQWQPRILENGDKAGTPEGTPLREQGETYRAPPPPHPSKSQSMNWYPEWPGSFFSPPTCSAWCLQPEASPFSTGLSVPCWMIFPSTNFKTSLEISIIK